MTTPNRIDDLTPVQLTKAMAACICVLVVLAMVLIVPSLLHYFEPLNPSGAVEAQLNARFDEVFVKTIYPIFSDVVKILLGLFAVHVTPKIVSALRRREP